MKGKFLGLISAGLTLLALSISSSASYWWLYQPKAPKSLHR